MKKGKVSEVNINVEKKNVSILCTGGTFDKVYDAVKEKLVVSKKPAVELIISAAQTDNIDISLVTHKDSLDLTKEEMISIRKSVYECKNNYIVIIHGTSRLIETSKFLGSVPNKTVVLTGAMVPNSIDPTEASFNLGFALASAKLLPSGVWIAMSGEVFNPDEVTKNINIGKFEKI